MYNIICGTPKQHSLQFGIALKIVKFFLERPFYLLLTDLINNFPTIISLILQNVGVLQRHTIVLLLDKSNSYSLLMHLGQLIFTNLRLISSSSSLHGMKC